MASPDFKNRRTPGVYISELNAFPPSIVGVQTAVPAFIGYTEQAQLAGKPVFNQAIKIGSLADFELIFGKGYTLTYKIKVLDLAVAADKAAIDAGSYDFKVQEVTVVSGEKTVGDWKYYILEHDTEASSQFCLYESMKFFYANGGANCYVVSVGPYKTADGKNKVKLTDLKAGLDVIKEQTGPTMLVVPEAILLPKTPDANGETYAAWVSKEFKTLVNDMLKQCAELQDRVAILDVYGSDLVKSQSDLDSVIGAFRKELDSNLNYGMAYFPFFHTTLVSGADYTYLNLKDGDSDAGKLSTILGWVNTGLYYDKNDTSSTSRYKLVGDDITKMADTRDEAGAHTLNQNLVASLPLLGEMEQILAQKDDVLPPSPAMAGIITRTDATKGVWNAPANTSVDSITSVTYKLNNTQQGDLNKPVDGKAVNAIREFPDRGTVVWGARTLDGNSNDWRYIQVRRTLIYIEQSVKAALDRFVFAANDGNTWVSVTSMISGFLQGLWSQGGLMGSTAQEAFSVECGLGSTMTGQDILDGYMIVQITVQMVRPAEFIELTFKQKMEGVA